VKQRLKSWDGPTEGVTIGASYSDFWCRTKGSSFFLDNNGSKRPYKQGGWEGLRDVFILNGPPGIGKDTLAALLVEAKPLTHLEFKTPLYKDTAAHFGVDLAAFTTAATSRLQKGNVLMQGLTPREMLIHVSEEIKKPLYGSDHYGKMACKPALKCGTNIIFSDGGFADEVHVLEAYFHVVVIRLHRRGFDFTGDSRSYVEGVKHSADVVLLDGHPELGVEDILKVMRLKGLTYDR